MCCLGFVVGALVEFAIIILVSRASGTHNNKVGGMTMSKAKLARSKPLNKRMQPNGKRTLGIYNQMEKDNSPTAQQAGNQGCFNSSLNVIDSVSFGIFTTLFLLFSNYQGMSIHLDLYNYNSYYHLIMYHK